MSVLFDILIVLQPSDTKFVNRLVKFKFVIAKFGFSKLRMTTTSIIGPIRFGTEPQSLI